MNLQGRAKVLIDYMMSQTYSSVENVVVSLEMILDDHEEIDTQLTWGNVLSYFREHGVRSYEESDFQAYYEGDTDELYPLFSKAHEILTEQCPSTYEELIAENK